MNSTPLPPETIRKLTDSYTRLRDFYSSQLQTIQNNICKHPDAEGKRGADTGNYCKQDDRYWVDLYCPDCGLNERVYTDAPEFRLLKYKEI